VSRSRPAPVEPGPLAPRPPTPAAPRPAAPGLPRAPAVIVNLFRAAAISNFLVTLPAFFAWDWYVGQFTTLPPNYPFTFWIWSGMAFLWGVMFWEISRDVLGRAPMLKYAWLEKMVTSTSVAVAYFSHNIPASVAIGVVLTDVIWIPLFMLAHWQVNQRLQRVAVA